MYIQYMVITITQYTSCLICTLREVRSITCADTAIIVNHRVADVVQR